MERNGERKVVGRTPLNVEFSYTERMSRLSGANCVWLALSLAVAVGGTAMMLEAMGPVISGDEAAAKRYVAGTAMSLMGVVVALPLKMPCDKRGVEVERTRTDLNPQRVTVAKDGHETRSAELVPGRLPKDRKLRFVLLPVHEEFAPPVSQ